jgi:hypothetical protein
MEKDDLKDETPSFCQTPVISWCGFIAQNLNWNANTFSFLFCAVGKNKNLKYDILRTLRRNAKTI